MSGPGLTALTRTPAGPNSADQALVSRASAALLDPYRAMPATPKWATMVSTLMIDPRPRAAMAGASSPARMKGAIGTLGAEVAETDSAARLATARGFRRWEARIRDGLRAMRARGDLPADVNPDDLALATLAALQGGLLLTQIQRETKPLEVALDAMLDRIQALTQAA